VCGCEEVYEGVRSCGKDARRENNGSYISESFWISVRAMFLSSHVKLRDRQVNTDISSMCFSTGVASDGMLSKSGRTALLLVSRDLQRLPSPERS
jgi:hypothetical protein